MTREEIARFFEGVTVNGMSRKVVFPVQSEEGYIEVRLVAHPNFGAEDVRLGIPKKAE